MMKSFKILCNSQARLDPGLQVTLLWPVVVALPASTPGSPPQAWGKAAWELMSRKASPQPLLPQDHSPFLHRHPEDSGRAIKEGLARWTGSPSEHHPSLHRSCQGRGQSHPRPQRV